MSGTELTVWAVLAGVVWLVGYAVACKVWPYTSCRRCGGGGRKRSPSGRNWRPCRKCKGTGARVRTGRRLLDWVFGQADKAR